MSPYVVVGCLQQGGELKLSNPVTFLRLQKRNLGNGFIELDLGAYRDGRSFRKLAMRHLSPPFAHADIFPVPRPLSITWEPHAQCDVWSAFGGAKIEFSP